MYGFNYHRPTSIDEAKKILAANADAKLLAGGMTLLPTMKLRLAQPSDLVDLSGIDGLDAISDSNVDRVLDLGLPHDLVDGAGEQQDAALDDADHVAQLRQLVKDVAGDDDRLTHPLELLEQLTNLDAGAGIETGGGLVHQQHLGIVQQDASNAEALLHAA